MLATLDRPDLAVIVSCASLLVAAVSLSWQIFSALRVDRARIVVTVAMNMGMVDPVSGKHLEVAIVNAANIGKRPAEVSFLALVGVPASPWYRRLTRRQRRKQHGSLLWVWVTIKKKEIRHIWSPWEEMTRSQLRTVLFEYIEVFYNRQRHQAGLDHRTPAETYTASRAA